MTERDILLKKISSTDFALVDMHLFLDTHPDNTEIAKKIKELQSKAMELRSEYESKFGPLMPSNKNGNKWHWISSPWPWDSVLEEEC